MVGSRCPLESPVVADANLMSDRCWRLPKDAPVSDKILTTWFQSKLKSTTIVPCHVSTDIFDIKKKEVIYQQLHGVPESLPKDEVAIAPDNLNANVGSSNAFFRHVMGKRGLGDLFTASSSAFMAQCLSIGPVKA